MILRCDVYGNSPLFFYLEVPAVFVPRHTIFSAFFHFCSRHRFCFASLCNGDTRTHGAKYEFFPTSRGTFPTPVKFCDSEESEEARMINQARLARYIKRETATRLLLGQSSTVDSSDGKSWTIVVPRGTSERRLKDGSAAVELKMHEEHRVIKLTDVTILPKVGETVLGTLEAHVNGYIQPQVLIRFSCMQM
ncbi:hypothetical protein MKX01_000864 [Papaver californicum]|nr:hypothetical protein MKX01_000864 [Papaver californicum]